MDNTLSSDITAADINAAYDNACKKLLSHKIILAWIMHSCLDEYRDIDVNDIAEKYIEGSPQIDTVGVMPEQTNSSINGLSNDDASINEHNIRYDIRFYASAPKGDGLIKLIINLEAQNKYHTSYPLIKRGIYYLSRMISSQYGTEFEHSHYENIKKVYSIWLCVNPPNERANTITRYSMHEDNLVGNAHENPANYDLLSAVMVCLGDEGDSNYSGVLKLLDVLLSSNIMPAEKKKVLTEDFDIAMSNELESEVEHMCNLSQGVAERAMQKGIQQGIQQGMQQGIQQGMQQGIQQGKEETLLMSIRNLMNIAKVTFEQAVAMLGIPSSEHDKYKQMLEIKYNYQN